MRRLISRRKASGETSVVLPIASGGALLTNLPEVPAERNCSLRRLQRILRVRKSVVLDVGGEANYNLIINDSVRKHMVGGQG